MATLLYIDGENLQFSLHDQYGVDLDPHTLLALAWTVGLIQEARFYADFSIFPRQVALKAYAAGIALLHIPGYPYPRLSIGQWGEQAQEHDGPAPQPGLPGADPYRASGGGGDCGLRRSRLRTPVGEAPAPGLYPDRPRCGRNHQLVAQNGRR